MNQLPVLHDQAREVLLFCINRSLRGKFATATINFIEFQGEISAATNSSFEVKPLSLTNILFFLESCGLVSVDRPRGLQADGIIKEFSLTHTGYYYFELEKQIETRENNRAINNYILYPVIVAVLVAFVTSILTTGIKVLIG